MVARALWGSEALTVISYALDYGSCKVSDQGTTLSASDLNNARATILVPLISTHIPHKKTNEIPMFLPKEFAIIMLHHNIVHVY